MKKLLFLFLICNFTLSFAQENNQDISLITKGKYTFERNG